MPEVPGITQYRYLQSYVVFQSTNFVVAILGRLFKTGKSGTQWYCVIPGKFSVLCQKYLCVIYFLLLRL